MSSSDVSKIIVAGAPKGRFVELFAKLGALHAKSNFAFALVVGDFFAEPAQDGTSDADVERLLNGEITVPLPTYITLGTQPLPSSVIARVEDDADQICENLFFLGKRGITKTSESIRLVTLGGQHDPSTTAATYTFPTTKYTPVYTRTDAQSLKGAGNSDILVTSDWPAGIEALASPAPPSLPSASPHIAQVAQFLRPRYHFVSGGDVFYERTPYVNELQQGESPADTRFTRFIALADFGNSAKAKALYAFTLNPTGPQTVPPSSTPLPYAPTKKRPAPESTGNMFFSGPDSEPKRRQHDRGGGRRGRNHGPRPPPGPESCFFCLSYPQLEKHLITSIGTESYLTTAKGPLTSERTNPKELPCSAHILIIPFAHSPTLGQIDEAETRVNTRKEMRRYKAAIEKMLDAHGCGAVTFEIRRRNGVHAHWQVVPVKKELLGEVRAKFDAAAAEERKEFREDDEKEGELAEREEPESQEADTFCYWVSGQEGKRWTMVIGGADEYFDLQFGRRVLAGVVGAGEDAVNWRNCVLGYDGEVKDAEEFKKRFKAYDFTLEE